MHVQTGGCSQSLLKCPQGERKAMHEISVSKVSLLPSMLPTMLPRVYAATAISKLFLFSLQCQPMVLVDRVTDSNC